MYFEVVLSLKIVLFLPRVNWFLKLFQLHLGRDDAILRYWQGAEAVNSIEHISEETHTYLLHYISLCN